MKGSRKQKLLQLATCLLCAAVAWRNESIIAPLEGTEFGGGWLTGSLLHLYDIGVVLFVPALLLTLFFRRIAAIITLMASLLCLPLYFYFVAPGPFRWIFSKAVFEAPLQARFRWNNWAILGILTLIAAMFLSIRTLSAPVRARSRELIAPGQKSSA